MAILGYDADHSGAAGAGAGRKVSSRFTLATNQALNELHAWVNGGAGNNFVIHIYTSTAGEPDALVAYTSPLAAVGTVEVSQSGFSNLLVAGDYWIGITMQTATGGYWVDGVGAPAIPFRRILSGSAYPTPASPWGTPTTSSTTNPIAVWAVVSTPAAAFVPQIVIL